MPAFEWVHVQLHQQKGMISLSPPTICNSATDDRVEFAFEFLPFIRLSSLIQA
nr:Mobile element protein [Klebsiella michiganensis]